MGTLDLKGKIRLINFTEYFNIYTHYTIINSLAETVLILFYHLQLYPRIEHSNDESRDVRALRTLDSLRYRLKTDLRTLIGFIQTEKEEKLQSKSEDIVEKEKETDVIQD